MMKNKIKKIFVILAVSTMLFSVVCSIGVYEVTPCDEIVISERFYD